MFGSKDALTLIDSKRPKAKKRSTTVDRSVWQRQCRLFSLSLFLKLMLGQSCASGLFRSRHKKHFLNYHVLACLVWSPQTRLQMSQRIIMKISGLFLVLFCFLQGFFCFVFFATDISSSLTLSNVQMTQWSLVWKWEQHEHWHIVTGQTMWWGYQSLHLQIV